jgi:hypothetical protein
VAAPKTDPVEIPSGFLKGEGPRAARGRWTDGDKVRFVGGRPQKIGGNARRNTSVFRGTARGMRAWDDLSSHTWLALGTTHRLYAASRAALSPLSTVAPTNITPIASTASLTNAFTTVIGSAVVTVADTAHGAVVGQGIEFTSASTVGGLAMTGQWEVASVISADSYTFVHSSAATSSAGPSGSATALYEIAPGSADPQHLLGWGVGGWGSGPWGTERPIGVSRIDDARYWTIDNFGKILIACVNGGGIYTWDPTTTPAPRATVMTDAPTANRFVFVTPERFVVALGCTPGAGGAQDPLTMRWCTQADYTNWTPSSSNTAGERRLLSGHKLMGGGTPGSGSSLIWTDTSLYLMRYTGSSFVYDTSLVGTSCGLLSPHAFTFAKGRAFWLGSNAFHTYAGSVATIPNSEAIRDWVFDQLRTDGYETKTFCFFNSRYNEVWWIFVPSDENEPAKYVAVNVESYDWVTGTLSRTSALRDDPNAFDGKPLMAATDGYIYEHESGKNDNGAAMRAFIESGPITIGPSSKQITGVLPDFAYQEGDLELEIAARDYSDAIEVDNARIILEPYCGLADARVEGRQISIRLTSDEVDGDFRLGSFHVETMPAGRRR